MSMATTDVSMLQSSCPYLYGPGSSTEGLDSSLDLWVLPCYQASPLSVWRGCGGMSGLKSGSPY